MAILKAHLVGMIMRQIDTQKYYQQFTHQALSAHLSFSSPSISTASKEILTSGKKRWQKIITCHYNKINSYDKIIFFLQLTFCTKYIFALLLLCFLPATLLAQDFTIKGRIIDSKTKESIEYATIVLNINDTVVVKGTTTDINGHFVFKKVKKNSYVLRVSMVGYETTEINLPQFAKNIDLDTLILNEAAETLEGVTVTASNTINRVDKKLIYITANQKKASTNGLDMIRQLSMPKVSYNVLNDELKATGDGELQLRINGIPANMQDVKAILPEDVIRIEYHDNPSLRYGNASVVLDYIVKRKESGGDVNANLRQSPYRGFGDHMLSAKVNHKKSEVSLSYYWHYRNFHQMWRDNLETYNYADGSRLQRTEDGLPGDLYQNDHAVKVSYNYQFSKNSTFNASFHYKFNQTQLDFHSMLYNVKTPENKVELWDKNENKGNRPWLDLYYEHKLKNDQSLFLNVVGTYNRSHSNRNYIELFDTQSLTDIASNIQVDNYSLIGEVIYEKQFKVGVLSAGLKHGQSWTESQFTGNTLYNSNMQQSDSYAYTEWRGKVKKFSYTGGVGIARNWFKQEQNEGYERYSFRPTLTLQYNFTDTHSLNLKGSVWNNSPSLTELSNVNQLIDSLQSQRGNPNLKPYLTYHTSFNYEIKKGWFSGTLSGSYTYSPDAIMDEKQLENRIFVKTFNNQRDFQILNGAMTLRASPFNGNLNIQFQQGINHYMSNGNHYAHRYTHWYYSASVSYTFKWFTAYAEIMDSPNFFRGETLYGGENIHFLGLTYKHDKFTVGAHVANLFLDNYKVLNENWSQYASYKQAMYINESSRLFFLTFSYRFEFGRKYQSTNKRLNNQDNNTGVESAGK